jgi:GntR family transcriptional regulator of vanillate catabolism
MPKIDAPPITDVEADTSQPQSVRAVLGLRGLIIKGELKPGMRVTEQNLVDRLRVSRTPARAALQSVCDEGLLEGLPSGGYVVTGFTEEDMFDSIAIRGNLEGMAARRAAERGAPPRVLDAMRRCVRELDDVVQALEPTGDLADYMRLNHEFHSLLQDAAQSAMLRRAIERSVSLPFASPNAFVNVEGVRTREDRIMLIVAHDQHRSLVEAIAHREGARAEALAVEHSRAASKYLGRVRNGETPATSMAALHLVVRRHG